MCKATAFALVIVKNAGRTGDGLMARLLGGPTGNMGNPEGVFRLEWTRAACGLRLFTTVIILFVRKVCMYSIRSKDKLIVLCYVMQKA